MTTEVTIKTADHPIELMIERHFTGPNDHGGHISSYSSESKFMPANSSETHYAAGRLTVHVNELPVDATGLGAAAGPGAGGLPSVV